MTSASPVEAGSMGGGRSGQGRVGADGGAMAWEAARVSGFGRGAGVLRCCRCASGA